MEPRESFAAFFVMPTTPSSSGNEAGGKSLVSQFNRGAFWTYGSLAATMVIQLGVTATTARLLEPTDFGLVAMANVLLRLGGYVAQMGLGRALIQRPEIHGADVRASFTSSTLLGLVVTIAVALTAPLAGTYYQTESVIPVIRSISLLFVATGLGTTAHALLRRRMRFRASGAVELTAYVLGYAIPALWLATSDCGVWSLVVATVGQAAVSSGLAYALTRHSVRPTFAWRQHRRLLAFGSKVSAISFLEFVGSTLDTLVIGRFGAASQLGLYNRAHMLASLPTYQLNNGLAKVLFPLLSGAQQDRTAFRMALSHVTQIATKVMLPVGVGMALAAPELVAVVLGPQWKAATPLLAVLALGMAINVLATFPGLALESLGVLRGKALGQVVFVTALGVVLFGMAHFRGFDLLNVAVTIAIASASRAVLYYFLAYRAGAYDLRALRRLASLALGSSLVGVLLIGGAVAAARAGGLPTLATVATTVFAGVIQLCLLFNKDIRRLALGQRGNRQMAEAADT